MPCFGSLAKAGEVGTIQGVIPRLVGFLFRRQPGFTIIT